MSEPKRYDNFQYETAGGEYVRYEDYASLKSEVKRLDNLVRYWSEKYQNENARFLRASERIAAKEGKQS